MRAVLLAGMALGMCLSQPAFPLFREISQSTDVGWLERLCTDRAYAEAEYAQRGHNVGGVKGSRSAAYVQLGALGTDDSLAAIARIEKHMHGRSVVPQPATPGTAVYHPAPHMTDWLWRPAVRATFSGGREVAAYVLNAYGPPSLYLAIGSSDGWSPPLLTSVSVAYGAPPQMTIRELPDERVRVEFSAPDSRNGATVYQPTPDAIEVSLAELRRDTDGDGWPDILERQLQMNWRNADSDRDGIPDGMDVTPSYRPTSAETDDDARILQRAIFAMFGFTDSSGALFVADNSRRLELDGLPGPVFYHEGNGGVRVTWKILDKGADTATVEITDFEGALAASGNDIVLKKIHDGWYVVKITMKWIS
jgi:hypothetical protein